MASQLILNEGAAPATPSTGQVTVYAKTDGLPYAKDDAGTETALGFVSPLDETQGGTAQTTYTTGDTLYASGANVLAKRTIGSTGQVLTVAGGIPTWATPASITLGTSVASTSGTSIDFSGLPAGLKRVVMTLSGVSTTGTGSLRIRIGPTAAVETTGYLGAASTIVGTVATANFTVGFDFTDGNASTTVRHGTIILSLLDSATNTWTAMGGVGQSDSARTNTINGSKPLASALGRVSFTTTNGTDTFDAGIVNIQYE